MRHILMTFDDGYWNNLKALPILELHKVPGVFFISTNYVKSGRAFWWDVIHRERLLQGVAQQNIWNEQNGLKRFTHDQIEGYLRQEFGEAALHPVSQDDRPMTPDELRDFSRHPLVHIGNHTHDHGILTNYAFEAVLEQITFAQDALHAWTGRRPRFISYPNGNFSHDVLRATAQAGLELGWTFKPVRNSNELREPLQIGRFFITRNRSEERAYTEFRVGFSLRRILARLVHT
jgi:peptidoglycan/xylan/chitin deacetylase (PgdA/CDA1 family)